MFCMQALDYSCSTYFSGNFFFLIVSGVRGKYVNRTFFFQKEECFFEQPSFEYDSYFRVFFSRLIHPAESLGIRLKFVAH